MKLRIRGNSIRLRLKRSEVERIASGASIVEHTHFPDSVLTYCLDVVADGEFTAGFGNGELRISLPASEVKQWAATDQVSLLAERDVGKDTPLTLLVEKDFECLSPGRHRTHEDDEDTFPHPQAASGSC